MRMSTVSWISVSKKLNEKSSALTDIILNQKTVVSGVINDVKDVSETERGMFPFL